MIDLLTAANLLMQNDSFHILTHQYPDGDTLGSAFALCHALQGLGKKASVIVCGDLPEKYSYMTKGLKTELFEPEFIVAVDIADEALLGENREKYAGKSNLCIDHHASNKEYAENIYVNSHAAATAEIIFSLLKLMNVKTSKIIADCIYTGVATDTGCFKYGNVTPETHRIAAELLELGCNHAHINKLMFETKSRQRLEMEKEVLNTLRYYCGGRVAVIFITKELIEKSKAKDDDLDGLASIPRQIEGVKVGITLREKDNGEMKFSVRTTQDIDASKICEHFGGGGHKAAAGCSVADTVENAAKLIVAQAEKALEQYDKEKEQKI